MWWGDYQPTPKTAGEKNILFWRVWTHPFDISKMGCFLKNLIVIPERQTKVHLNSWMKLSLTCGLLQMMVEK